MAIVSRYESKHLTEPGELLLFSFLKAVVLTRSERLEAFGGLLDDGEDVLHARSRHFQCLQRLEDVQDPGNGVAGEPRALRGGGDVDVRPRLLAAAVPPERRHGGRIAAAGRASKERRYRGRRLPRGPLNFVDGVLWSPLPEVPVVNAVSYTHLTLPTICSV